MRYMERSVKLPPRHPWRAGPRLDPIGDVRHLQHAAARPAQGVRHTLRTGRRLDAARDFDPPTTAKGVTMRIIPKENWTLTDIFLERVRVSPQGKAHRWYDGKDWGDMTGKRGRDRSRPLAGGAWRRKISNLASASVCVRATAWSGCASTRRRSA